MWPLNVKAYNGDLPGPVARAPSMTIMGFIHGEVDTVYWDS